MGVSVWSGDVGAPAPLQIGLHHCRIDAGRALSLRTPPGQITLSAADSEFRFREALLAVAGAPGTTRRADVTWQGDGNRYAGAGAWLWVEDRPTAVRGLAAWRAFWNNAERASREGEGGTVGG